MVVVDLSIDRSIYGVPECVWDLLEVASMIVVDVDCESRAGHRSSHGLSHWTGLADGYGDGYGAEIKWVSEKLVLSDAIIEGG